MSDLQFDDQRNEFGAPPVEARGTDLTGKIVSWGLASNAQQAQYILIGIVVIALIAGYFIFKSFSGGGAPPPPPAANTSAE
ncbi:MAG: hypothetical protein JO019_00645 [Candidatus Kaiserbacteria bacterium]|nr:hypothetical protein [Candidatus Kaiserbacteria bacterium]